MLTQEIAIYIAGYGIWVASTAYDIGDTIVVESSACFQVSAATGDKLTGTAEPTWNPGAVSIADNHVTWIPVNSAYFVQEMPSTPDDCTYLKELAGPAPLSSLPHDYPKVQILCRGLQDPVEVHDRAWAIYNKLQGFLQGYFVPGGTYIESCIAVSNPYDIGHDENHRRLFTMTFQLHVYNPNRSNTL